MSLNPRTKRKVAGLGVLCLAALAFLSLFLRDHTGLLGIWLGDFLADLFGYCGALLPCLAVLVGLRMLKGGALSGYVLNLTGYSLLVLSVMIMLGALPPPHAGAWAGDFGTWLGLTVRQALGYTGLLVIAAFLAVLGLWLTRYEPVVVRSSAFARSLGGGLFKGGKAVLAGTWAGGRAALKGVWFGGKAALTGVGSWINRQRLTRRTRLATVSPSS